MRPLLYLEPIGGIAGDMFLAASLELGVAPEAITSALSGLKLKGWRLVPSRAERHAILGTHLDVEIDAAGAAHEHRSLADILAMISAAGTMSAAARQRAAEVFTLVGQAEAHIHGVPIERIHFHEVGAVDSIVDICGAAVALELLGDPEVFAAPPPLGSGAVRGAHGVIPAPSPAALEILKDVPVRFEGVGELTTPTGAALLKAFARIGPPPEMVVERIGYGVGTKDFPDRANVLRACLGRRAHAAEAGTFQLEANLDDMSPQLLGALLERLLEAGALDAHILPATMKKGRPGHLLGVLAPADRREALVELMLSETTTLGVRSHRVERTALSRRFEEVKTPFGPVRMKLGERNGQLLNAHPEFEDVRQRAQEAQVPLKRVWEAAVAAFWGARGP